MTRYRIERALPYRAEQIFDLVAEVERYPEFLPWWAAARVRRRAADSYETDQVLRVGLVRDRFVTTTRLERPRRIEVTSADPLFRTFRLSWRFEPEGEARCRVVLETEVVFRSRLRQRVLDLVLTNLPVAIVDAFERRAESRLGTGASARPC